MLILSINVAIIVVTGVICFSLIDWFVRGKQLGNLLKILVALICLAAVVQRVLPALGWVHLSWASRCMAAVPRCRFIDRDLDDAVRLALRGLIHESAAWSQQGWNAKVVLAGAREG
jgi:uncharacterized protein YggT (Ycf19 family)